MLSSSQMITQNTKDNVISRMTALNVKDIFIIQPDNFVVSDRVRSAVYCTRAQVYV
jgi:hypothetical protein